MPPVRVAHVIARMNVGGPAVEIAGLMRGLPNSELDQVLITGCCGPDEADYLQTQGTDLEALRIPGLGRSINPPDELLVFTRLMSTLRKLKPDVVHTHTAKAGVIGRLAAQAAVPRARIVHTYHGHLLNGYFNRPKTQAVVVAERALACITDRIVTVGQQVRDDLLHARIGKPHQYEVIKSGVPTPVLPESSIARREFGVPNDACVVSLIGRITAIKRPDRFADVVALVRDKNPDVHFLVAGGGDREPYLRQRVAAENLPVTMLGWRDDVSTLLAATDIMLLTSDNEGTPLSLVQAGLAGIPVVATNVGSVKEVVVGGATGYLVEPGVREIAEALLDLIGSPETRQRFGVSAQQWCSREFGESAFLTHHLDLYEEIRHRS